MNLGQTLENLLLTQIPPDCASKVLNVASNILTAADTIDLSAVINAFNIDGI